jgi:hypothetical protein
MNTTVPPMVNITEFPFSELGEPAYDTSTMLVLLTLVCFPVVCGMYDRIARMFCTLYTKKKAINPEEIVKLKLKVNPPLTRRVRRKTVL